MSVKKIAILSSISAILLIGMIFTLMAVGYSNTEIELRKACNAQQEVNKTVKDKTWKVLKQKAGIVDKYAEDFSKVFNNIMAERYEGEDRGQSPMFKWIKEHNPEYSIELYKDLSDAIEANQAEFLTAQKRLLDIKREHGALLEKFPSSIVVGKRDTLDVVIVISTATSEAFKTGIDDDVDIFQKK